MNQCVAFCLRAYYPPAFLPSLSQSFNPPSDDPPFLFFTPWVMTPKCKPEPPTLPTALVLIDNVSPLQARSPILTAPSHFFKIHSRFTLDLIQSTVIASTISPKRCGRAIDYHKIMKTWTSPLYTAPRPYSFRPFPGMDVISTICSSFSFTSH